MQKNKCYGKYIILGVFSLLILSCNILPMSNTLTKTEEEKSFSTQANINTPKLKTIPDFRFNEEDEAVETKGTAYLSAGMIQNNPPVEESYVYNSDDDYFYYAPYLYYSIVNREVKLSGSFKATFIETTKYIDAGKIGRAWHAGEVTIAGTISGTPDKLKLDFSSSTLYKSTSLINFNGCDYTHTNVMRGGNFSGSAFLLGGNLYISGNLSGQGAVDAGGWCASHPSSQKPMSANFSMKSYVKEKPPVKVEVIANKEKTEFYKTNGKEKIRIEVTALNETRWRLEIKGYDDDNNPRTYYLDGSGNKDIDWDGKTNDALNPQDDVFFADSYSASKKTSTGYYTYPKLKPLEVKLTSADGMESKAKIKIDNTPPEIKIDKIEGNVIKGVINDVSEIDQASLPKEFTDGDKRISITYSNNPNPSNYRLDSNNTVNFKSLIFEAKVYGFDSTTDDIEDYKYSVGSKIEDELKDKLGNQSLKLNIDSETYEETNEISQDFSIKQGLLEKPIEKTVSKVAGSNVEKLLLGEVISEYSFLVPAIGTGAGIGLFISGKLNDEADAISSKTKMDCEEELNKSQGNVKFNTATYKIGEPLYSSELKRKVRKPLSISSNFSIYATHCDGEDLKIPVFVGVGGYSVRIHDKNKKDKPILLSKSGATRGFYSSFTKKVYMSPRLWYGSTKYQTQITDEQLVHPPFVKTGSYIVRIGISNITNGKKVLRAWGSARKTLNIKNEREWYNEPFKKGSFWIQSVSPLSPLALTDERKFHIRARHDVTFLNGIQFVKGIVRNANQYYISLDDIVMKFKDVESHKGTSFKFTNYPSPATDAEVENLFKNINDIANMNNINDYLESNPDSNLLKIVGKRNGRTIRVLVNRNQATSAVFIGSAFPEDNTNSGLDDTQVKSYFSSVSRSDLMDSFNNSLQWSKSKLIEKEFLDKMVNPANNNGYPRTNPSASQPVKPDMKFISPNGRVNNSIFSPNDNKEKGLFRRLNKVYEAKQAVKYYD